MRKVVRLTENDLARIVKRVIKESTKPTLPIFIKLVQPSSKDYYNMFQGFITDITGVKYNPKSPLLVNVMSISKHTSQGCEFNTIIKGGGEMKIKIQCDGEQVEVKIPSQYTQMGDVYYYFNVSPQAMSQLKRACACTAYVSNQNKDTQQSTVGGGTYV